MDPDVASEAKLEITLEPARHQRDQALACALLALIIVLAMLRSNFGPESKEMRVARAAVQQHETLLAQNEEVLRANQKVLGQTQADLEKLRQALGTQRP